jgi:hypothetical protein
MAWVVRGFDDGDRLRAVLAAIAGATIGTLTSRFMVEGNGYLINADDPQRPMHP